MESRLHLPRRPASWKIPVLVLLILALAYFTYLHRYWHPPYLFWDENYHVAAAQKYLHGTFFMEPHPPLGKLLIAFGEYLMAPESNGGSSQFLDTDHAPETPQGFSFRGYRLIPALLAWLSAPLLFGIAYLLTRQPALSAFLSLLYVFDNALIVHSRSAMLESTLHFFSLSMIFLFLWRLEESGSRVRNNLLAALFGVCFAAVMTTKITGLIMGLLFVPMLWRLWKSEDPVRAIRDLVLSSGLAFAVVFVAVWQMHFSLAASINPALPEEGFYQASEEYRGILERGESGSLRHFPTMLRDSMAFVGHYQQGVPKLDLCKEGENGSPWFFWPIGARAINYRWETEGGDEAAEYQYLYLQSNPAVWLLGVAGVLLALTLLLGSLLLPLRQGLENRFMLACFLALWLGYMTAMSRLDRVMYLYHYFLPLLFSFLLFGLVLRELRSVGGRKILIKHRVMALATGTVAVFACFWLYSPLTYYRPITDEDFMRRSWVRLWDLHCVRCPPTSPLVRQACD